MLHGAKCELVMIPTTAVSTVLSKDTINSATKFSHSLGDSGPHSGYQGVSQTLTYFTSVVLQVSD